MYIDKKNLKYREPTDDEHNQILLRYGDRYTKATTVCMIPIVIAIVAGIFSKYTLVIGVIAIISVAKMEYANLHLGRNINKRNYKVAKCYILEQESHGEIGQGYNTISSIIMVKTEFGETCYNKFDFNNTIDKNEELLIVTDNKIYETMKIGKL